MLDGLIGSLNHRLAKLSFGTKVRIAFYNQLVMMMENRVMLADAMREMYSIASRDGTKPGNGYAIVLQSCYDAVTQGSTLADGLRQWAPANEVAVIAAGEQAGDMGSAFRDAVTMIEAGAKIRGAVIGASIYPMVLIAMLCVLLNIVANSLVPKMAAISNPETWQGSAYVLYLVAQFVTHYGLVAALSLVTAIVLVLGSLPLLGGRLRVVLDSVPPWSIYRTIHGSIFMLNVAMMIRSGMMLQSALDLLASRASSRWLRERISGTLEHISLGAGFGEALSDTGYNFPDAGAIRYLKLLSRLQGFDQAMTEFARHWLHETIAKVQAASRVFLMAAIFMMGGTLVMVVTAMSSIQESIEQSVTRTSM